MEKFSAVFFFFFWYWFYGYLAFRINNIIRPSWRISFFFPFLSLSGMNFGRNSLCYLRRKKNEEEEKVLSPSLLKSFPREAYSELSKSFCVPLLPSSSPSTFCCTITDLPSDPTTRQIAVSTPLMPLNINKIYMKRRRHV